MKKRRRSRSRKSSGPASPSRSGEPTSPCRSGESASSDRSGESASPDRSGEAAASSDRSGERAFSSSADPDREDGDGSMQHRMSEDGDGSPSGEGASSASAAPDREGGDEIMQHGRSEDRDGSPSPGEETAVRPKQRHKKEKGRVFGPVVPIPSETLAEATVALVSDPVERKEKEMKQRKERKKRKKEKRREKEKQILSDLHMQHDGALVIEESSTALEQQQDKTPSLSPNPLLTIDPFADLQDAGEASETSAAPPSGKMKGKLAQEEDEHSDKKPPSVVEDEHSDEIGVHAIEDHKQEQGMAVSHVQALLGIDNDTMKEKIVYCLRQLKNDSPEDPFDWSEYDDPQQLTELYRRLALYRIRGYDYEFSVDRKLAELDDVALAQHYPPTILDEEGYFDRYEEYLEWYFDPELCKYAGFEDYQRLVLRNDGLYRNWDCYKSTLHTYEKDLAYVQYCEAIENETKWVYDYLLDCPVPWERVENVAYLQSLEVAAGFRNIVSKSLLVKGFKEYIRSLRIDFCNYKADIDGVYFEIWKRVAKRKMDFIEALSEVYQQKMFPLRSIDMEQDLEDPSRRWSMKAKYEAYVACIGDSVSDDEARPLITEAVKKMSPKSKDYVDYAKRKLEIAKEIRLVMEGEKNRDCSAMQGR